MIPYFLHTANLMLLCSFLVRDIFFLRLISILASVLFSVYFYFQDPPMWSAMAWNIVFVFVNVVQISKLLYRRRKIPLGANELLLQKFLFSALNARDIRALYSVAEHHRLSDGHALHQDAPYQKRLVFVLHGTASAQRGLIVQGDIIGVQGFIAQKDCAVALMAKEDLQCISWSHDAVRAWSTREPERRSQLMLVFSQVLAKQLNSVQSA